MNDDSMIYCAIAFLALVLLASCQPNIAAASPAPVIQYEVQPEATQAEIEAEFEQYMIENYFEDWRRYHNEQFNNVLNSLDVSDGVKTPTAVGPDEWSS